MLPKALPLGELPSKARLRGRSSTRQQADPRRIRNRLPPPSAPSLARGLSAKLTGGAGLCQLWCLRQLWCFAVKFPLWGSDFVGEVALDVLPPPATTSPNKSAKCLSLIVGAGHDPPGSRVLPQLLGHRRIRTKKPRSGREVPVVQTVTPSQPPPLSESATTIVFNW